MGGCQFIYLIWKKEKVRYKVCPFQKLFETTADKKQRKNKINTTVYSSEEFCPSLNWFFNFVSCLVYSHMLFLLFPNNNNNNKKPETAIKSTKEEVVVEDCQCLCLNVKFFFKFVICFSARRRILDVSPRLQILPA